MELRISNLKGNAVRKSPSVIPAKAGIQRFTLRARLGIAKPRREALRQAQDRQFRNPRDPIAEYTLLFERRR